MHFLVTLKNRFFKLLASILDGFWESFGGPKKHQNHKSQKSENEYHSYTEYKVLLFGEDPKPWTDPSFFDTFYEVYKMGLRKSIFANLEANFGVRISVIFASDPF